MSNPSDSTEPKDMVTTITELKDSIASLTETVGRGWPLDKRETIAAMALMGLASRLQPLHLNDREARTRLAPLAFDLADLAVAESAKEPKAK